MSPKRDAGARAEWEERIGKRSTTGAVSQGQHAAVALPPPDSLMADPGRALQVLDRLCAMGLHISIDDFGTGYSSLAYLRQLPVHELKIDRSFVRQMSEGDAVIVRSTISLAHDLGLTVVAEGVEDMATWARLGEFECDLIQGYLVSRPLPAAVLGKWMMTSTWNRGARGVSLAA